MRYHKVRNTSGDAKYFTYGISRSGIKEEDSIISERGKKKPLASGQFGYPGVCTSSDDGRNIFKCQIKHKKILIGSDDCVVHSLPDGYLFDDVTYFHGAQHLFERYWF